MGRPEKLTKEQQNALVGDLSHRKPIKEVCAQYGVSEFTARRYWKAAKLNAEAQAGQRAEEIRTAEEIAAEQNPTLPEAA